MARDNTSDIVWIGQMASKGSAIAVLVWSAVAIARNMWAEWRCEAGWQYPGDR